MEEEELGKTWTTELPSTEVQCDSSSSTQPELDEDEADVLSPKSRDDVYMQEVEKLVKQRLTAEESDNTIVKTTASKLVEGRSLTFDEDGVVTPKLPMSQRLMVDPKKPKSKSLVSKNDSSSVVRKSKSEGALHQAKSSTSKFPLPSYLRRNQRVAPAPGHTTTGTSIVITTHCE